VKKDVLMRAGLGTTVSDIGPKFVGKAMEKIQERCARVPGASEREAPAHANGFRPLACAA